MDPVERKVALKALLQDFQEQGHSALTNPLYKHILTAIESYDQSFL
jgi:hypothetical protein